MKRVLGGVAALVVALVAASASAQDPGTAIPLSTSLGRACEGRLEVTQLNLRGAPLGAPQVVLSRRGLFAQPDARGIALTQWAREPAGEGRVIATIAPDGTLLSARVEGPLIEAMAAQSPTRLDREGLAQGLAQDIPERVVFGRRFQVGDDLYTPDAVDKIADQLIAAMGLGFPVESSAEVRFTGVETLPSGREAYVFVGPLQISGEGLSPGGTVGVNASFVYRIAYDVESGLVAQSDNGGPFTLSLNGEVVRRIQFRDFYTCEIAPQAGD